MNNQKLGLLQNLSRRFYRFRHRKELLTDKSDGKVWHSWDPTPWKHPWLTKRNLREMRLLSDRIISTDLKVLEEHNFNDYIIGFVGNIANNLYIRAVPLRKSGGNVNIFLHPQDDYIMSHPSWEEFDGSLPPDITTVKACKAVGIDLPFVEGIYQFENDGNWLVNSKSEKAKYLRSQDIDNEYSYLANLPTLDALQSCDVLLGVQNTYLSYLSNRPYLTTQSGGEVWFEASLNSELGKLQRLAYVKSRLFLVSNPWSYAHARRLGFTNLVHLPYILDDKEYYPDEGPYREVWKKKYGGDFFVLSSTRIDNRSKGSKIGIEGFSRFSKKFPNARLVLMGWGNDLEKETKLISELGLSSKVIFLPLAGKARLRKYLQSADAFLDQFILGYYGSAGLEAMACSLPVLARVEVEQYEALFGNGKLPILNVETPAAVSNTLCKLACDSVYLNKVSLDHRKWFMDNHSASRWSESYKAVLIATALNRPVDFQQSILNNRLSLREKYYHAKGLALSPLHPNYGW